MLKKITIDGVGLIGGSLGLRVKAQRPEIHVTGTGRRESSLKLAKETGAIDDWTLDPANAVKEADLLIICTPVSLIVPQVKKFIPYMKKGAILTDVGSVKKNIIEEIEPLLPEGIHFVGAHPMAGNEKTGVSAAQENLFENAVCVITPTEKLEPHALKGVEQLWHLAGAHVLTMPPDEHDRITAAISHLPHLVASLVVRTAARDGNRKKTLSLAAGGFRDTTRIAAGDPVMWRDIFLQNRSALLEAIARFKEELAAFEDVISREAGSEIETRLAESKKTRDNIRHFKEGILPTFHPIYIRISDQPGQLADVTRILSDSKFNIKDIALTQSREDEEGPLCISFEDEATAEKAVQALKDNQYDAWIH